jgi:endonuclease/exonuclease/phosphatase family metal-dependent hydrolase
MPRIATAFAAATLAIFSALPVAADEAAVRVMTWNMDEGTGFQEIIAAPTPEAFGAAVLQTYRNILATRPAERAAAMARDIARHRPDLVALQEASVLRSGPPPDLHVDSNLLDGVLAELARLGEPYEAIVVQPGLDAEVPLASTFHVRLTTQDAILARVDRDRGFRITNPRSAHFAVNLTVQTPAGPFTLPRSWASVDVHTHEGPFRFVTTHLDLAPPIQRLQMLELLAVAASPPMPVALVGDFNAVADDPADASFPTYEAAIAAGFADAWRARHPREAGFTCCQAADLLNAVSQLDQRIDLVFLRGLRVADIHRVGNRTSERTASGLWPSDHAGLAATLEVAGH